MTDWAKLRHAYGSAADIPALLERLSPDAEADVWDELWSRLCHQGTIYSASLAALPVLADLAEAWKPAERVQLLALAASILASDDLHRVDEDVSVRANDIAPRFQRLCQESLAERGLSIHDFIYVLEAARSLDGDRFWGQELNHLASSEFFGACPHCSVDLYLVIGEFGSFTTAEEWVLRPSVTQEINSKGGLLRSVKRYLSVFAGAYETDPSSVEAATGTMRVRPDITRTSIEPNSGELPEAGQWFHERARSADQNEVAAWIRYVFGTSKCPSCNRGFHVMDAIIAG